MRSAVSRLASVPLQRVQTSKSRYRNSISTCFSGSVLVTPIVYHSSVKVFIDRDDILGKRTQQQGFSGITACPAAWVWQVTGKFHNTRQLATSSRSMGNLSRRPTVASVAGHFLVLTGAISEQVSGDVHCDGSYCFESSTAIAPGASLFSSHTTQFRVGFGEFLLRGLDLNSRSLVPEPVLTRQVHLVRAHFGRSDRLRRKPQTEPLVETNL